MPEQNIVTRFKSNLKRLRKERGFSQRELARKIGVSQRLITYYEDRAIDIPLSKVEVLSKALEVSVAQLLDMKVCNDEITHVDIRILKKVRQIQELPKRAQDALIHTINTALNMDRMQKKSKEATNKKSK